MIDYILEPVCLNILLYYYFPHLSLIIRLITQDSIYSSFRYLLTRMTIPIKLCDISSLPKYSYYLIISLIYYMFYVLTWGCFNMDYLYIFFTTISSPIILNYILDKNPGLLENLEIVQKNIRHYLASLCLSCTINFICRKCLDKDPKLSAFYLSTKIKTQNHQYVWIFCKIFIIHTLIQYFEQFNYLSVKLIKILHDTGNLIDIPVSHRSMIKPVQIINPKETLAWIIIKQKWHYFYDPTVLNLIIKVYQNGKGDLLQKFIDDFKTKTLQFLSLWSLHQFIPIPILAFIFRMKNHYPHNIIIPFIDIILLILIPKEIILISFISEFGDYINNPLTRHIYNKILGLFPEFTKLLFYKQKYTFYLIFSIPVIHLIHKLDNYHLLLLPIISKYNFIYFWMLLFGLFSNYDLLHLTILALILYLMINIVSYKEILFNNFNINIIDSYFTTDNIGDVTDNMKINIEENIKKNIEEDIPIKIYQK